MNTTLITGATSGIGEALVYRLAAKKHNLLLVARNEPKLKKLCDELSNKQGIVAQYIVADLSKPNSAYRVFEESQNRGFSIALLVNNAGIGSGGEFSELTLKSELDMLQLNMLSLVALTHLFLPQMKQRKGGTIVNVASLAAFAPIPYMATYAASKVFVRSFTEAITQECLPYQVDIMLFCPGLTKTNFNSAAGIDNEKAGGLSSDYNSSPTQTPEEVADEMMKALEKKKHFAVSGRLNRLASTISALFPNRFIARFMAKSYRKKLKYNV